MKQGRYDIVRTGSLVFDASAPEFGDDEFGFEPREYRLVTVACREVLDRGGDAALFQALEDSGHLGVIARCTRVAIDQAVQAVSKDSAWQQVRADLGEFDADRLTREAIKFAVMAIMESETSDEVE